jgi:hypothetical protein
VVVEIAISGVVEKLAIIKGTFSVVVLDWRRI